MNRAMTMEEFEQNCKDAVDKTKAEYLKNGLDWPFDRSNETSGRAIKARHEAGMIDIGKIYTNEIPENKTFKFSKAQDPSKW